MWNLKTVAVVAAFWLMLVGVVLLETNFRPSSLPAWIAVGIVGPPAYVLFEVVSDSAFNGLSPYSRRRKLGPIERVLLLVITCATVFACSVYLAYR